MSSQDQKFNEAIAKLEYHTAELKRYNGQIARNTQNISDTNISIAKMYENFSNAIIDFNEVKIDQKEHKKGFDELRDMVRDIKDNQVPTTEVMANSDFRKASLVLEEKRRRDWANLKWVGGFIGVGTLLNLLRTFFGVI